MKSQLWLVLSVCLIACGSGPATSRIEAPHTAPSAPAAGPRLSLPPRPADAPTGSQFIDRAIGLGVGEREQAIVAEILRGNVPEFERRLVAVELRAKSPDGAALSGRVFVVPDYLAIGTDADFVRVPMTVRAARKIARETACVLPTTRLVDAIHQSAPLRIPSPYLPPGNEMTGVSYFVEHHRIIEERRVAAAQPLGALLSGPKKDLVITSRMLSTPRRTPIYGWFNADGSVIQELSLVHDDHYSDYAHGVRLISQTMEVAGEERLLLDVLATREVAPLISGEGSFDLRFVWQKGW